MSEPEGRQKPNSGTEADRLDARQREAIEREAALKEREDEEPVPHFLLHRHLPPMPRMPSRWMRRLGFSGAITLLFLAGCVVALYYIASSATFENALRYRMVLAMEQATGGRVEIAAFHWDLLHLRADAEGITIHGLEAAGEAPYAHVDRLSAQISVLNFFTLHAPTRVILRELEVQKPAFHLIVYPDGSTNQPHPKTPSKPGKPILDTLFDLRIGKLRVEQGVAHIANQVVPFTFSANDTNLQLAWLPDAGATMEPGRNVSGSYRIQLGLSELTFAQGKFQPVPSRIDASLQLFHDSAHLDSLRLVSQQRTLNLRGTLDNFAHPVWTAQANGQVDLRLLAPLTTIPSIDSGVVSLSSTVRGRGGEFQATGEVASDALHYRDSIVDGHPVGFSARFRADARQLMVTQIHTRLAQGGEASADFQFDNWLESTPSLAVRRELTRAHKSWLIPTGIVHANLNGVTLDTLLVMLAAPSVRHLGLDAVITGPATATWTSFGDDLEIDGQLALAPSVVPVPGEAPVTGFIDALFPVAAGAVKVHSMEVRTPHSLIQGRGLVGVFPIERASQMDLDFNSSDLSEFDAILRTLALKTGDRVGTDALPVRLKGQAEFHGRLNSSWLTPRVEGHLTATNIAIEIPSGASADSRGSAAGETPPAPAPDAHVEPAFVSWDAVDADGIYTPASITLRHSLLRRGEATLSLQGHIDSSNPAYKLSDTALEFGENSFVSVKATAHQFPLADLLPLTGVTAPITGQLNAQLDFEGAMKGLAGTGSIEVTNARVYGSSIDHLRASGSISNAGGEELLTITSLTAQQGLGAGGQVNASGTYNLAHRRFTVDARAAALDLANLQSALAQSAGTPPANVVVTGKLGVTVIGEGTLDDPRLQARATMSHIAVAGEPLSDLLISAHTGQHAAVYDLSSHQAAGEFTAHGETRLDADYSTQATLQFAKFDIGGLLKLLHVTGISGQSDLEGTARVSGPLAHPEKLSGEASLRELALVVQGVHLASKGAVHATLTNGLARLDPVEITGEDTDMNIRGTLGVTGKQQLDLAANGSINLRLAESLDPDLIASGVTSFQMEAHGPLLSPILQGRVEFQNAAIALQDFPNGLSQIKGTLEFIQNRLTVRSLTAMSGGGQLSVSGYLGFQRGIYADLIATGKSIRIRYPQGVSSLADANLRLQGPQSNLLLSGNVEVTRFAINSDLDIASLTAQSKGVQPIISPDAPSNHLRLDVHLTSAPQLNFQNAFAKLAGDVDLHLRGTLASPSVLGRISLTDGSTTISGTKYELERGDINFNNPVRIQPNIDLDATARVEDYDITLGLHGTPDKLKISYRSEPPLPEADVLALLALGRTQDEQRLNSVQQQQAGDNPMTDALLGGAFNATVSNRVQRLFGSGAIKVDPNFIGSLGNSSARVTVVEQIGKNLTFTYASNVNTTAQQLIQAEIAINRHVSLLVTQDESGIFSMVVKARRRFK